MVQEEELRRVGLGELAVLHDHLISYITFLLSLEDVVRLSCCSRLLRVFACEEPLWLGLCLKQQEGLVEYKANWRQTALASYTSKQVPPEALQAAARPLAPLPGLSSLFLYKRWYRCHVDLRGFLPPAGAPSVDRVPAAAASMTPADFAARYDRPNLPVLLGGCTDLWPVASWSLEALSAAFPAATFHVSKPHGGRALMTLPAYVDYMARQADEEPLYIFDPDFVEAAPGMRQLYDVPHVFTQDYLSHLGGGRPHYRWLVLGPARSGASWHVDPSLTTAWNALLSGRKRWALYPPHMRPPGMLLDSDGEDCHTSDDNLTSLQWFLEVYPGLPPERRPIEFVQEPGDVVFVPGGWWHCVLNLETAVAVTQNFVSDANLARVGRYMAHGSAHYHAHPLQYYDPRTEVAAWAAAYPTLMATAAADAARAADAALDEEGSPEEGKGEEEGEMEVDGEGAGTANVCRVRALRARLLAAVAAEEGARGPDHAMTTASASAAVPASSNVVTWHSEMEYEEVAVWRRHRPLGRWLRRLWEREPHTRPAIEDCLFRHLHGATWRAVLRAIAVQVNSLQGPSRQASNGLTVNGHSHHHGSTGESNKPARGAQPVASSPLELIPLMGADAMVFLYGSTAIKIFAHEVPAMRSLMCALESQVPRLLLPATVAAAAAAGNGAVVADGSGDGVPPPQLPVPLVCGAVAVSLTQREPWRGEAREVAGGAEGADAGNQPGWSTPAAPATQDTGAAGCEEPGTMLSGGRRKRPREHGEEWEEEEEGQKGVKAEAGSRRRGMEAAREQEVFYVVQQRLQAAHDLQGFLDCKPQPAHLAAVAEALGDLVGAMHATAATTTTTPTAGATAAASCTAAAVVGGGSNGTKDSCEVGIVDVEAWRRLIRGAAVWHDRSGRIWVSGVGRVSAPVDPAESDGADEDAPQEQEEGTQGVDGVVEDGGRPVAMVAKAVVVTDPRVSGPTGGDDDATAAAAGTSRWPPCNVPLCSPWWPFVQHLRRRQRSLLRSVQRGEADGEWCPSWVREQLPAFLPSDPAELLGFTAPPAEAAVTAAAAPSADVAPPPVVVDVVPASPPEGTRPGVTAAGAAAVGPGVPPPVLLHGDLTALNVVLDEMPPSDGKGDGGGKAPWRPRLGLVDFSDAGHGDPLWELLPVLASCTAYDRAAMACFWAAYRRHMDVGRLWPQRRQRRLSYCALCYSLLHDEAESMLQRLLAEELLSRGGGDTATAAVAAGGATPGAAAASNAASAGGDDAGGAAKGAVSGPEAVMNAGGGGGSGSNSGGGGRSGGGSAGVKAAAAMRERVRLAGGQRTLESLATSLWGFLDES